MSASPEMSGSPGLAELQLRAEAAPGDFFARMNLGAALHAAGLPERALVAFEKALAISPGDTNAASACAALMLELSRPQAAYRLLQSMAPQLLRDADGAANLAIAAFVDALRFNANHGLVDALRMGVPAISCAGNSMASRLGGSIIRAAGLPDCVFEDPSAYLAAGIALGRDAGKLTRLRQQLQAARPTAPLFDAQARVREWEAAWTVMAERSRAGLPPAAFDVPSRSVSEMLSN